MNNDTQDVLKWVRTIRPEELPYDVTSVGWGPKETNGVETGEYALIFTVKEKKPVEQLPVNEIIPKQYQVYNTYFKTDVQEVTINSKLLTDCHTVSNTVEPVSINRNRQRPLQPGLESGLDWDLFVSTLGLLVRDKTDGQIVALSNNHVYGAGQTVTALLTGTNDNGTTSIQNLSGYQPTGFYNTTQEQDFIGIAKRPVLIGNINSALNASGWVTETSCDAAILSLKDYNSIDLNISPNIIGFSEPGPYEFATDEEIDSLLNPGSPNYQAPIFRSGRTCGPVGFPGNTNSCNLSVYQFNTAVVGLYSTRVVRFTNSFWVRGDVVPGRGGDSGSAMLALFNANSESLSAWKVIGLLFAGPDVSFPTYTIGCRITNIVRDLDIVSWDSTLPSLSATSTYTLLTATTPTVVLSGRKFFQIGKKE